MAPRQIVDDASFGAGGELRDAIEDYYNPQPNGRPDDIPTGTAAETASSSGRLVNRQRQHPVHELAAGA